MDATTSPGKTGPRMAAGPHAETAADLMTPTSLAIPENTTVHNALAALNEKRVTSAAVVDALGQPVGVVNRADLEAAKRDKGGRRRTSPHDPAHARPISVRDLMTPVFFSIRPETPAERVIQEIRALRLNRLFVMADGRGLVGFINGTTLLDSDASRESYRLRLDIRSAFR
jgi:CBS domain-containing protein